MAFLVFDGTDGSGKTTQLNLLKQQLEANGKTVQVMSHPRHEGLGKIIRQTLFEKRQRFSAWTESFLYGADQADSVENLIVPSLKRDEWVLAHRWLFSSLVYQSVLDGAPYDSVCALSRLACPVTPTASLIFVCDPKLACERIAARDESSSPYENYDDLIKARDGFVQVAEDREIAWAGPRHLIDTTGKTVEETQAEVAAILAQYKVL